MMRTTYADSGVNIELGDDISKMLYTAAKTTWDNRKGKLGELIVPFDDFSGVRAIDVSHLPSGTLMNIGFDGIGTKMELAERLGDYRTMAFDLFAMVCDDAVVRGAEPVLIGSILDVNSLKKEEVSFSEQVKQLAEGYVHAARAANVAIVNGEVAELGHRVGGFGDFNCNWGAAVVWFAKKDRLFTGKEVQKGDYLVGLQEMGFRSNGLSLFRKIMKNAYGDDWHTAKYKDFNIGRMAMIPSQIYCRAVVDMFGGFDGEPKTEVHGVAHITGGGLPGKLTRVLKPSGLGAVIDSPFEPSRLMEYCHQVGNVTDDEAYKTWNMGQGMVVITPKPDDVISIAQNHGIGSKVIGWVTSDPTLKIANRGYFSKGGGDYLKF